MSEMSNENLVKGLKAHRDMLMIQAEKLNAAIRLFEGAYDAPAKGTKIVEFVPNADVKKEKRKYKKT